MSHGTVAIPPSDSAIRSGHAACRISVVVPTRNRPELLARMLARIQSQTFTAFDVIVVDDGSSSDTRAAYPALWEMLDSRFTLIQLGSPGAPGSGPSTARNLGIEAAAGDIITFCDDDDFWTSDDHLAAMAEVFAADPQVDLYIANQQAVSCTGAVERPHWMPGLLALTRDRARSHPRGYRIDLEELAHAGGFAQLNILAVRKATAVAIGGFWTRTSYEEDRDFYWRAVDAARAIFFNPDIVAQHNIPDPSRQNNLSRSFSQAERWLIAALVSQHIALNVSNPTIRTLVQYYEGDTLRSLSRLMSGEGKHALGLQYARRALAARVSLKWAVYTMALACRQLMRRSAA